MSLNNSLLIKIKPDYENKQLFNPKKEKSDNCCSYFNVCDMLMGTRAEGFKELSVTHVRLKPGTTVKTQMLFDGGMTQAQGQRSTHTHAYAHRGSLLFSFLAAWELAAGPQTSHQEGGER